LALSLDPRQRLPRLLKVFLNQTQNSFDDCQALWDRKFFEFFQCLYLCHIASLARQNGATPIIRQVHAAVNVASSAVGARILVLHKEMLSLRDDRAYRELYDLVIETLPPPDLLVYLQASVPTLMERIGRRGRGIESGITADYLERLGALYAEWLEDFNLCPVLTVPADNLDFVQHDTHLQIISERILAKLQGKEEVVFPNM
jgi:hypothetical protein